MMNGAECRMEGRTMVIALSGTIDSVSAPDVDRTIHEALTADTPEALILDLEKLVYITSAGLRVILRLKQEIADTRLINVSSEVYGVLEMTGFTELMPVEKAYRVVSVEGCEIIGHGANGKVYRISPDTIVKVYRNPDALPEIHRERRLARTAFVAGIPTAIPYDVVRIEGGGYGSIFELLEATSFAKLLLSGEKTLDEVVAMSIDLLKLIHSKSVRSDILPSVKDVVIKWLDSIDKLLPAGQSAKLRALIDAVPEDPHLIHGDYHLKNIMLQNGEALLIDMDTLSHGNPVFELACMYNAYQGFGCADHRETEHFLGVSWETATAFWRKSIRLYLGTEDEAVLRAAEDKIRVLSCIRVIYHFVRHGGMENPTSRATIDSCLAQLAELLPVTDTLLL